MTLFENFNYLLFLPRYLKVPDEIGRMFPWILWIIWKNRNLFLFEGKEFAVEDTMAKVIEDSGHWFEVQKRRDEEDEAGNRELRVRDRWEGPSAGSLKCNVGLQWSKRNKTLGAAWVLRNCGGETLLHSRRAFANVESFVDEKFLALLWAIESMQSHHVTKVIFEVYFADLVGAVTKPKAWPAFRY
ncbi:unnamed protein product [Brassica oleracea]